MSEAYEKYEIPQHRIEENLDKVAIHERFPTQAIDAIVEKGELQQDIDAAPKTPPAITECVNKGTMKHGLCVWCGEAIEFNNDTIDAAIVGMRKHVLVCNESPYAQTILDLNNQNTAMREALEKAKEEIRLVHMKDKIVYSTTLITQIEQALAGGK
jgi:hypothetical protein